jgi:NAD(P)-dependent dehydrogenase (short-subunit alcohol dehydrogenase family)
MAKTILITGASSGLGQGIAKFLAEKGHNVYGTSRKTLPAQNSVKMLLMDVNDEESISNAIATVVEETGKIDVLINNAGLGLAGVAEHLQNEDMQKVFATNVFGLLNVCQQVLPVMRKHQDGMIINISSIGSEMGLPYRGGYSASKAAVDRLTEAMRMEVKQFGIKVCIVQPGDIQSNINANRVTSPVPEGSPYKEKFDIAHKGMNEGVAHGLDPFTFGPVIEKIIRKKNPSIYYRVGKPTEKLSVLIKRMIPGKQFEKILMKHFDL